MTAGAPRVVVAMGSNVGDRAAHLRYAVVRLRDLLDDVRMSSWVETRPLGVPGTQGPFLNGVAVGSSAIPARDLLEGLLAIERARGRTRPFRGAARTLDLDLILVGDVVMAGPDVTLPHPRFRQRLFVLGPLCEIAPDLRDPVTDLTVRELLMRAKLSGEEVCLDVSRSEAGRRPDRPA